MTKCPRHPMWCLIGCYVCGVKWLALFLSFFFPSISSPRWRQKHECLSAKSSFEWLNYSSTSRKTRMFRSPRLPIMSKGHENIFRCLIFHFSTVCTTETTVHNVHCISSASGFNSRQWLCKPLCQSTDGIKHAVCKPPAALNHHFPSSFSQLLRRQHPVQLV